MIVKQIAALIKYNTLSSFRKRKEDWGIPQLNSKLLSAIIISLLCLYLVFLGCGVVFGTKLIQAPLSAWGQFVLIAVSLERLLGQLASLKNITMPFCWIRVRSFIN